MNNNTTLPNTVNRTTALTSSTKTKEDRMRELEVLLVEAKKNVIMPDDVKEIVELFSGQSIKLGTKSLVDIPPMANWGQYEVKKGKLEGQQVFTCLGRFAPISLGNIGNRHISMQVQISILPIAK